MVRKLFFILLIIVGCSKKQEENTIAKDAPFRELDATVTGLNFSNDLKPDGKLNIIEYLYYYNGGGVALGDINNDGLDDVYLTANQKADKLFLNLGDLKFKDISLESGISQDSSWSTGVTMADVNNDGLLDIYVCKVGDYKDMKATNELYINKGNGVFEEKAKDYGLNFSGFSTQASFFDYDNDGDLDMYLMNHSVHSPHSYGNIRLRKKSDSLAGDQFFENILETDKPGFKNVTDKAGLYSSSLGYGLGLATADVNNDGFIDIYVGNDFHENDYLYINNGNKTFTESSADYFNHTTRFTMGVDIADIDNNGYLDIFSLDMMPYEAEIFLKSGGEDSDKVNQIKNSFGYNQQYARNHMQLNNGRYFTDVALFTNTYATDWSWSPLIFDYNNDGLKDIYITNGIYKRPNDLDYVNFLSTVDFAEYAINAQDSIESKLINKMPMYSLPNTLFQNADSLHFSKIPVLAKNTSSYSNGAAYSDLDNDGDLDIIVNNLNDQAAVLENMSSGNNYLTINLLGSDKKLNTNGSKVYLYADGKVQFAQQATVKGFQSSSTGNIHFGLGSLDRIDSLKVIWNDGSITKITKDIKINTVLRVLKDTGSIAYFKEQNPAKARTFDYEHEENTFLDYERERLIIEKLSLEGPSVVQADFNADGLQDLFIGGARNQSPALYLQNKNGDFNNVNIPVFEEDKIYEDVDAIALDIDGDNDLDIYALSGGNDYLEGDPMLEDRVYINDGKGNFTKLFSNLLATNGGSVSSADFNNDGLPDLFVGSRSIPNAYGLSPYSYILRNKGNNTFEIADKRRFGMVTDSKWADLDNDGNIELIVTGDWMPIRVFTYDKEGKFEEKTQKYGLDKTNGLWNTITLADIDNNGKIDIVAGNTGLNFKWKATPDKPVKMYLDDFDNNKSLDQLIFYDFFGTYVPFASRDKLVEHIPSLKKKFLSYNDFSKISSITDLTQKKETDIMETKFIYELRSMVYFNKGGFFEGKSLPTEAQLSSVEDILIDGDLILYTGNYYGYVTELGETSSNAGGVITKDNGALKHFTYLNLPKEISGRHLIKLNENEVLIIANNGKSYIVKLNK